MKLLPESSTCRSGRLRAGVLCLVMAFGLTAAARAQGEAAGQPGTRAASEGEEAELVLRDGRRISGRLVSRSDTKIVFEVGGVPTTFESAGVDRIESVPSVEERYRALRSSIDEADAQGLMRLAEWLRSRGRCDLAVLEVDRALAADPGNPDGRALRLLIVEQQKLEAAARLAKERKTAGPEVEASAPKAKPKAEPLAFLLLSEEQINVIRVYEVDLASPPKMVMAREAIDEFLAKYAGQRPEGRETIPVNEQGRKIYAARKPVEILTDLFALKARDFYPKVQVLENPESMRRFRDDVNRTWLVNSCATTRCHGGEEAGRLMLFDRKAASDVAAYTNFLILERFRVAGADGRRTVPLINYAEPASSPLLQMGLPRDEATIRHPDLPAEMAGRWRPVFRSPQDDRFRRAVEWIRSMYGAKDGKRPDYPVAYEPPQPRTPPAPAPTR
ncbi:MAG: hypothetical protein WCK33_00900 [Phycisphaerae bacterium]|jgi:hypothetical protein